MRKRPLLRTLAAAAPLALVAVAACAGEAPARGPKGELSVLQPFLAEPPLSIGALYLTIDNRTTVDDALVGATSPAASEIVVHGDDMADLAGGLPLPAGRRTRLEPGHAHLMLSGLDEVREGASVPVTLEFARHAPITVDVPVAALGATEAP